jgi:hypothetical protein
LRDPEPYNWKVAVEAYKQLDEEGRQQVIEVLTSRVSKLEKGINKGLRTQPAPIWKLIDSLEETLEAGDLVIGTEFAGIPDNLLLAVLNAFRTKDLADLLITVDEDLLMKKQNSVFSVAGMRRFTADLQENYWTRANNIITRIVQVRGGFGNAEETLFELFKYVLEHNRFTAGHRMRQRQIALLLYNEFYRRTSKK